MGSEFPCPKSPVCGLTFGVGEIIWGLIFLVCHCPSHFLSIKVYFELESRLFGVFEKAGLIIGGLRKLLDISTLVSKVKQLPPPPGGDFLSIIQ